MGKTFTAAVVRGGLFFLCNVHTQIFAEGFQDKILDTAMLTTLGCALSNQTSFLRLSAFGFFAEAVAQGALQCFYEIFIPKYSQRGSGTKYLILKLSLHLDVHSSMKPQAPTPECGQSSFSLLP